MCIKYGCIGTFYLQHGNGAVSLRGQHVDEGIGVLVQRNRGRRLQQLAIEGGEDAHVVIGASRGADDSGVLKIYLIITPEYTASL